MGLVLASSSPRRRDLLREAGYSFDIQPVEVDETPEPGLGVKAAALAIAERKARAAAARCAGTILAADTVVSIDGEILGKPADNREARRMIERLSGRTHEVFTAVCVLDTGTGALRRCVVASRVRFRPLSPEEVEAYAAGGEGLDKAGGYGIQGAAGAFVLSLEGPVDNVVGLPMEAVREMLG
ncbi:MAG: Maf family protein [Planctomycetes bacterium]|nr:Maf family protein [Planctomycetota bacterium]